LRRAANPLFLGDPTISAEPFQTARDLPFSRRLAQAGMAAFCDYWIRLGGAAGVASYRDFDPLAVPRLPPDLQITPREADGRHRIGLTGGQVAELMGRNNTGRCLDEVMSADLYASRTALYDGALATGMPVAYRAYLIAPGREHRFHKRPLLPFVEAGPAPDLVLAMALDSHPMPGESPARDKDGIVEIMVAQRAELRLAPAAERALAKDAPIQ
jgi:hypothetical protein